MVFDTLPVAFPWYDKIEKQARYKSHADGVCDYRLNTPSDALLPFQFRRTSTTFIPDKWEILNINTNVVVADISASIGLIHARTRLTFDYFYYGGESLTSSSGPLQLDPGMFYYSRITMKNGQQFYSEMFFVPDIYFTIAGSPSTNLIKLTWYNNADLAPIFYNDKDGSGIPYFKNTVYLDSFVHASEPEIEEETTNDGNDNPIPTFQRAVIKYRITDAVPDFLKVALVLMQMHDYIYLTTPGNVYAGQLEKIETASTLEANGFLSIVDILFEENVAIVKKACANNMALPEIVIPGEPILYSVSVSGDHVNVLGLIPSSEMWGILWGSDLPDGTFEIVSGPLQYAEIMAGTAHVPLTSIGDKYFFYLEAKTFNISGFISNTVPKT